MIVAGMNPFSQFSIALFPRVGEARSSLNILINVRGGMSFSHFFEALRDAVLQVSTMISCQFDNSAVHAVRCSLLSVCL